MRFIERSLRSAAIIAAFVVLSSPPSSAWAGEPESKTLFAEGRRLREAGKCDEAIASFRKALETWPDGLGALRNMAECEEKIGRYAAARRDYWDLRRAVKQSSDMKYASWEKTSDEAYARLEAKVPRLTIKLTGTDLSRVSVAIDGRPVDPRLVGTDLELDTGTITVAAEYGGAAPVTEKVTLTEGTHASVTLAIPALAPIPAATAPIAPPVTPDQKPFPTRTVGYVAIGVGGLSVAAMIASIAIRGSALSTINSTCPTHVNCPPSLSGDLSKGQTAATLADVFGAVALVGLGVGITLVALSPSAPSPQKSSAPSAQFMISPSFAGVSASAQLRF